MSYGWARRPFFEKLVIIVHIFEGSIEFNLEMIVGLLQLKLGQNAGGRLESQSHTI